MKKWKWKKKWGLLIYDDTKDTELKGKLLGKYSGSSYGKLPSMDEQESYFIWRDRKEMDRN